MSQNTYPGTQAGGFEIEEIDRPIDTISECYEDRYGTPLGVLQTAATMAGDIGQLAVFDAGCGTGRGLVEMGDGVVRQLGWNPERVTGAGISRHDYRGLSRAPEVNDALRVRGGRYNYIVGNAERMSRVGSRRFNLVLSHDGLVYSRWPNRWLAEMARVAAPGAVIFFNAMPSQYAENSLLWHGVQNLRERGYGVVPRDGMMGSDNRYPVVYFRIQKPL